MTNEIKKIRVAFFGSSEFSVPTLKYLLLAKEIDVISVITLPPAEKNRGKKLSNNVVYDFAIQNGVESNCIFTPEKLKNNNEILSILKEQNLDFIVVVSYGKIIPKEIIDLPNFEILNLHPSRLPKYRGAAPIERAIEAGEKEIDICIMKVDVGLDTGDVAKRLPYSLNETLTARDIVPEIAEIGGKLMVDTIKQCFDKNIFFTPQSNEGMIYAKKIEKSELFLNLEDKNLDAEQVFNKIRAFNNCGGCYFLLNNQRIKILSCDFQKCNNTNLGFNRNDGCLYFKNGIIRPMIIQKEGKKPMTLKDFLNGLK